MNRVQLESPAESVGVSRRALLGGAVAALAAGLSGACSSGGGSAQTRAQTGPFSYTDDQGKKITLPAVPTRIVAQITSAAALWDFGVRPIGVFGPQKLPNGATSYETGSVDLGAVQSVGTNWGEFNVEKYASLRPDLLVTTQVGTVTSGVNEQAQSRIQKIAPIALIYVAGKSASDLIDSYARLASDLGADVSGTTLKQAREEFLRASDEVRAATRAKPGLKVLALTGMKGNALVARPNELSGLKYFRELGLDLVEPGGKTPFFEYVSWEQIDKYPADLILYDARELNILWPLKQVESVPTWQRLPAVKAGQVGPWRDETPYSYQQFTKTLRELADTVNKARPDVVT